jgi:hypothetical protein
VKGEGSDPYVDIEKKSLEEGEVAADWKYARWNRALNCERFRQRQRNDFLVLEIGKNRCTVVLVDRDI